MNGIVNGVTSDMHAVNASDYRIVCEFSVWYILDVKWLTFTSVTMIFHANNSNGKCFLKFAWELMMKVEL